jgi:hypothetical protein
MNNVDELTMMIMGNNIYNEKITNKKTNNDSSLYKDELFYRKRLIQYYKNLFKKDYSTNKYINNQFHCFNRNLINIIKQNDKNDFIQEKIVGKIDTIKTQEKEDLNNETSIKIIEESNNFLKNNEIKTCTLDNYILKKPNKFKKKMVIPTKVNIDLKNQSYKTKGIKKKNINNNYEDKKK